MGNSDEIMALKAETAFCRAHGIAFDEDYETRDCACWREQAMGCNPVLVYRRPYVGEAGGETGLRGKCPDCGYEHIPPDGELFDVRVICLHHDDSADEDDRENTTE